MALDPYNPCPCGSGKKLKFCCSKDILPDLEKVVRALDGKQHVLALEHVGELIASKGARPSLLTVKAQLQLEADGAEGAEETIQELAKLTPYNPTATALAARLALSNGNIELMVEQLQRSLEYVESEIPPVVYHTIGLVAEALYLSGMVVAAGSHWELQAALTQGKDERAMEFLMRLRTSKDLPFIFKERMSVVEPPDDAPWAGEFRAAMASGGRGAWLAACESLASLADKVGEQPMIVRNIAVMRMWLGQNAESAKYWRRYSEFEDVPESERIVAALFSETLWEPEDSEKVPLVSVTYPVTDSERAIEALLSDKRAVSSQVMPSQGDEPAAKAAFELLDRPLVDYEESWTRDDIARSLGEIRVFGKQTDRDARLEIMTLKNASFEAAKAAVVGIAGEWLGEPSGEEIIGELSAANEAMQVRWFFPRNLTSERQRKFLREEQHHLLMHRWPDLPHDALDGKTPAEVAADDAYRVRLEAAITALEDSINWDDDELDFNELRQKLGLPNRGKMSGEGLAAEECLLLELVRLDPTTLSDEDLVAGFRRLAYSRMGKPTLSFGRELLGRDSCESLLPRSMVYRLLAASGLRAEDSLELVVAAREWAVSQKESPAEWLLMELPIRMEMGEPETANQILQTLQQRHINEPGIAEKLFALLRDLGVISQDGSPRAARRQKPSPPEAVPPTAAQPGRSGLPDQATGGDQPKSKLWVPD